MGNVQNSQIVTGGQIVTNVNKITDSSQLAQLFLPAGWMHFFFVERGALTCYCGQERLYLPVGGVLCLSDGRQFVDPQLSPDSALFTFSLILDTHFPLDTGWVLAHFGLTAAEEGGVLIDAPVYLYLSPVNLEKAVLLFGLISEEIRQGQRDADLAILAYVLEFLTMISRARNLSGRYGASSFPLVADVIAIFEQEYANLLTLDDLCERLSVSKSKLLTAFKYATGRTPMVYLTEVRMKHAVHLIVSTDLSITSIAYLSGFPDSNYFIRKFHQYMGTTPLQYRKRPLKKLFT